LQAKPEGIIDSMVSVIGLWNGDKPVAVLSFYATHPQSYYLTRVANPDFPGIARFYRQLEVPDALHVHFNGAGENLAAGKYNDGSHEIRAVLAARLADGMKRAWDLYNPIEIDSDDLDWKTEPVSLHPAKGVAEEIPSLAQICNLCLASDCKNSELFSEGNTLTIPASNIVCNFIE
jgi:hypothetical protein